MKHLLTAILLLAFAHTAAGEKNVSLDYLEAAPGGWIKVRHRDGQSGYVRANQVWGI